MSFLPETRKPDGLNQVVSTLTDVIKKAANAPETIDYSDEFLDELLEDFDEISATLDEDSYQIMAGLADEITATKELDEKEKRAEIVIRFCETFLKCIDVNVDSVLPPEKSESEVIEGWTTDFMKRYAEAMAGTNGISLESLTQFPTPEWFSPRERRLISQGKSAPQTAIDTLKVLGMPDILRKGRSARRLGEEEAAVIVEDIRTQIEVQMQKWGAADL